MQSEPTETARLVRAWPRPRLLSMAKPNCCWRWPADCARWNWATCVCGRWRLLRQQRSAPSPPGGHRCGEGGLWRARRARQTSG